MSPLARLVGVLAAVSWLSSAPAVAQEALAVGPEPLEPPHYVLTATAGMPLRLTRNVDFDQETLAPAFFDALAGYVLSGGGVHRHGVALGLSLNLTDDGGFTEPVLESEQLALMPAYLGFWDLDPELFAIGHLGLPFLLSGGESVGLELAFGLGYRLRAGAGLYAELGANTFVGADSTLHPTVSLEAGVFLDYEALP